MFLLAIRKKKSSGAASTALAKKGFERKVLLSRWAMPVRKPEDAAVAAIYKDLLSGTGIEVADNTVTPNLLNELKKQGVAIKESGLVEGSEIRRSAREDETQGDIRYSLRDYASDGTDIYETDEKTKSLSYKDRMQKFIDLAATDYRGRTARVYKNGHGYYALFEEPDIRKTIYGDNRSDKNGKKAIINQGADGAIFDLVEKAKYTGGALESGKKTKEHEGNNAFDYFVKTVQIDGRVFDLLIDVKKGKPDSMFIPSG